MNNIYQDYFDTLRYYLLNLEIKDEKIEGCTDQEIKSLEDKYGVLPIAYKEYLRTIGKKMLFVFMDAENMSYEDIDIAIAFGNEVFVENKYKMERPHLIISERRYEFITLLYLDEGDNPSTWIMSEDWDEETDGENLSKRTKTFTDLMTIFFGRTLLNYPYGFYWINEKEKGDSQKIIESKFKKWAQNLRKIKSEIEKNEGIVNPLVIELNKEFEYYYEANIDFINETLEEPKIPSEENKGILEEEPSKQKRGFIKWIENIFKRN